jgi:hypothetical protein
MPPRVRRKRFNLVTLLLAAAAAASGDAQATPAGECVDDLAALAPYLLANDAGARDELARKGQATFDAALVAARTQAAAAVDDASCLAALRSYLLVFRRAHLSVRSTGPTDAALRPQAPKPTFRVLGDDTALLAIPSFADQAGEAIARILDEHAGEIARRANLIVDVRGNSGGLLTGAISIASMFLPERALVLKTDARMAEWKQEYRVDSAKLRKFARDDVLASARTLPLAVLVDGGTGAGAEILAAALQDHKRATLVGQSTFGKGDLQNLFPLGAGKGAVRLTVATCVTPAGKPIEALGIQPAINVEAVPEPGDFGGEKDPVLTAALQALK